MSDIVIVAAKRTPYGKFLGSLSKRSALDLGCVAGAAVLGQIDRSRVDLVIVGNVLGAGIGMNLARQVGVTLGIPHRVPAFTVNMMCASGMKAVMLAADAIRTNEADVVLCGGIESMSNAPHLLPGVRMGNKFGDASIIDSILKDGLTDCFDGQHMGVTAERLADKYSITREEQDEFALQSQRRYRDAHRDGLFRDEIASVGDLEADEHPRPEAALADLARLRPAFKQGGSVTAGNSSGMNDGAAMLLIARKSVAQRHGWRPLATIDSYASAGCDPALMGLGPVHAVRALLAKASVGLDHYEVIELNEAFAAQSLSCIRELSLDVAKVNVCGGAIALGHPIGSTGARLIAHLAHRIAASNVKTALATLCVGGGMGTAVSMRATQA